MNESNALYHHGVKGMKWGQRKAESYNAKADSHIQKIGSSRTRLGKNYHNRLATNYRSGARVQTRSNNSKGIAKQISFGYGADRYKSEAEYRDRKAAHSTTRLGKTWNKSAAYNLRTDSNNLKRLSESKGLINKGKTVADQVKNTKYKTWSGRTVTNGQLFVESMLPPVGAVKDINYYRKTK